MRHLPFALLFFACSIQQPQQTTSSATSARMAIEWTAQPPSYPPKRTAAAIENAAQTCVTVVVRSATGAARAQGDPIHGVDVKLGLTASGQAVATGTTNEDGAVTFCGLELPEGPNALRAFVEGADPTDSAPFVVLADAVRLEWVTEPKATVSGRHVLGDADACPAVRAIRLAASHTAPASTSAARLDGDPIPGIDVRVIQAPGGDEHVFTTNGSGVASLCGFHIGAVAGAFNLRASTDGGRPVLSNAFVVQ